MKMSDQQKQMAATGALTGNVLAVNWGLAGTVLALGAIAAGVAATGGLGAIVLGAAAIGAGGVSLSMWGVGNDFQAMANDPPREDVNVVSLYRPLVPAGRRNSNSSVAAFEDFAENLFNLSSALKCTTESFERSMHIDTLDQNLAHTKTLTQNQTKAIQHNVSATASLLTASKTGVGNVNRAWQELSVRPPSTPVNSDEVVAKFKDFWGQHSAFFTSRFKLDPPSVSTQVLELVRQGSTQDLTRFDGSSFFADMTNKFAQLEAAAGQIPPPNL